jgi:hypothetical protein
MCAVRYGWPPRPASCPLPGDAASNQPESCGQIVIAVHGDTAYVFLDGDLDVTAAPAVLEAIHAPSPSTLTGS